jgi:hypothetical protein
MLPVFVLINPNNSPARKGASINRGSAWNIANARAEKKIAE